MRLIGVMATILIASASLPVHAQSKADANTIFQIGDFDGSSREFFRGTPKQAVVFVAGQSDSAKAWYAFQPVETDPKSPDSAPRAIQFTLQHPVSSTYTLHVTLLINHASLPMLGVDINGHFGTFYLDAKLDGSQGGWFPALSRADVQFEFPGQYLNPQGVNTIAFSAVPTSEKQIADAGFNYDAIELKSIPQRKFDERTAALTITPTIFYKEDGGLKEVVNARVRYRQPIGSGTIELTVNGKHYAQPLQADNNFGELERSFLLPDFGTQTEAKGELHVNGRTQRFNQLIQPKKKWTLYVVPHVHLDIGYTDYQAKVAGIQSRILDEALDLMKQHPDFQFSTDGMWSVEQFLATRSDSEKARAIDAVKSGHLHIPAEYSNQLTGFPTAEALIRSLYPSANFSREHGTPFDYANITDVPSYSWSYASILASAGIRYLPAAANDGRAPVLVYGHLDEDSPFWWKGPDGKKVLVWYARHYHQVSSLFGLPFLLSAGQDMLPVFLQRYERPGYLSDAAILYGSQVENSDLFPQQAELAEQWNDVYAYPHLQYSGFREALEHIANQFGDTIPTITGDGGPYWEDGIASDALYTAMERKNENRGPSAEKLAAISSLVDPRLAPDKSRLDTMWKNILLMDEHTWNASDARADPATDEVIQQGAVKDSYAIQADWAVDRILRTGMANLANSIAAGPSNLVVFNMLNWTRTGLVEADVQNGKAIVDRVTGQKVQAEILRTGRDVSRMRFLAQDVPAVGYKVYEIRQAEEVKPAEAAAESPAPATATLENSYYRVDLDPDSGSVRDIYDKQLQRSLVDRQSPYRFGQYLYVTSPAGNSSKRGSQRFNVQGAAQGRLVSIERTSFGQVARLESSATNTPRIASEIRLFDREKKIEFIEDVDKNGVRDDEAAYFSFPFAMAQPRFRYEIQNGSVDPSKDMYPGGGVDWFSVQHWVSVEQDGVSATVLPVDAPLVTLGDITRLQFPKEFGTRKGWVFSYIMNNYWGTNYRPVQGGHFQFRYAVTSAPSTEPSFLSRIGWEEVTPLEVDEITPSDKAVDRPEPLDASQGSFLQVNDPNLLLEAWKSAEDGNGTILRFLDLGGQDREVTVQVPLVNIDGAWRTDAVERGQSPLSRVGAHGFSFEVQPHEIVTIRVTGVPALSPKAISPGDSTPERSVPLVSTNSVYR
jgi:alpha-mannosidase